ncbi:MAG: hypothetical protein ACI30I_05815 [Parabacteroides sp.]
MKRISLFLICLMLCGMPGFGQVWVSINWAAPHCDNCLWMEHALHLHGKRAADYHRIIHKYGEKIEREACRASHYWEESAERIFNLRMERDRALQRLLSPAEFGLYVRFIRESPTRAHDYRNWYHARRPEFRPSHHCMAYEDHYWNSKWSYKQGRWNNHYERKPAHSEPRKEWYKDQKKQKEHPRQYADRPRKQEKKEHKYERK